MTASLDLYVEVQVLGQDKRFVREAGVSFGRPTIRPVADTELSAHDQRRPDLTKLRFTALVLPFDLEDLPIGRHYTEATVRMTFDDPLVCSARLPRLDVQQGQDSERATFGGGRAQLSWKLTARDKQRGMRPGGRVVCAVVESPLSAGRLTGELDASVRFSRTTFGVTSEPEAKSKQPLRFVLDLLAGDCVLAEQSSV